MSSEVKDGGVSLGTVAGCYRLEAVLGSGASGTLYAASDATGRRVAVKLSHPQDELAAQRLLFEGRTVLRIEHTNLARILDFGVDERRIYLVRELVVGASVAELLARSGPLREADALAVGLAVSAALSELHRNRVIHRDLKPSNVIVPSADAGAPDFVAAKLTDLDVLGQLTRRAASDLLQTRAGQVYGTPLYMAPEQITGAPQTATTDVYGFGTLLFEMLYGRPPFEAKNFIALAAAVLQADVSFPSTPHVTPAVQSLLRTCLEKDPARRFGDAVALHDALERIATGAPFSAVDDRPGAGPAPAAVAAALPAPKPASLPVRPAAPASVRRALVAGSAVALVAALAVVATALLGVRHAPAVALGVGSIVVSVGAGLLLHHWIERRRPGIQSDIARLLTRSSHARDLRKSLAIDLEELLAACKELDQRILAQTIAVMLKEYDRAKKSADRQEALMRAVALLEKLMQRLSPWYVRHQKTVTWGVSIVGSVAGVVKTVSAILKALGAAP